MSKILLACFAHPDDETFGTGGTLAYYASQGVDVSLVCATRGEAGNIANQLATPETLGSVREEELRCAARIMGFSNVMFLDYRDSGMAGSPDNQNPRAFTNIPAGEVVPRLVEIIRRLKPNAILTFEPNGGYGHPDHIAIHHHTVAAFHAAGQEGLYPERGIPWQAERLFYTAIPRSFFKNALLRMQELGLDTTAFAKFTESTNAGWPDEQINAIIDVSSCIEEKWAAFHCHQTQMGPDFLFKQLPEQDIKQFMSKEYFSLAHPTPRQGLCLNDLFAPLT